MSRSRRRGGRGGGPPQTVTIENTPTQNPPRIVRTGEVIDLGDLSTVAATREPVDATFGYFGQRFRVNPELSEIDAMDFMDEASNVNPTDPKAVTLVKRWTQATLHPDDFQPFWKLVRAKGLDSAGIMALMWTILDGILDLPTGPPSDSSDGRPNTSQPSPPTSSAPDGSPSTPVVYTPTDLYGPAAATPVADGAEAFLRLIDKYQARGDGYGVAMAAQVAAMAESKGIDVSRGPSARLTG